MSSSRSLLRAIYESLGQPNFLRWLQWPTFMDLLNGQDDSVILDLGAGSMQYAVRLAKKTRNKVIAVDWIISPESAAIARRHNIVALRANGQALPFSDRSVDRIIMSSLLHMVPVPKLLLEECRRVLRSDGCLVLSTPNHYRFIPGVLSKNKWRWVRKMLRLPSDNAALISLLNHRFGVGGPKGYYSRTELDDLLKTSGFCPEEHRYTPGPVGSGLWEMGVLGYVRFGNRAFHALFLLYPLARLCDMILQSGSGSEHIVKASPVHED